MIEDRNKTDLTKQVTASAIAYLDERGCKPIETEVRVADGWVADVASVVNPTRTELVDLKLIDRAPKWGDPRRDLWNSMTAELFKPMTVVVEVKTSRSDFRGDKKWTLPCPSNLAYLAVPFDLKIEDSEIPVGWGVLSCGESVRLRAKPTVHSVTTEQQLALVLQVAMRRDNDTRYERIRELRRRDCKERAERTGITRALSAMRAMESIVLGKHGSVDEALAYHDIKGLPDYYKKSLEKLWSTSIANLDQASAV